MDGTLTVAFHMFRDAASHLTSQQYAGIINITSRGQFGDVKASSCAANAGIMGLAKALSLGRGAQGVTVNAVAPAIIDTKRLRTCLVSQAWKSAPRRCCRSNTSAASMKSPAGCATSHPRTRASYPGKWCTSAAGAMAELSIEINSQGAAAPALAQTLSQWALNLRFDQAPIYVQ